MNKKKYILACESSCDETAFALYDTNKNKIIDAEIYSQSEIHEKFYGGVFPELASELHFSIIDKLLDNLLNRSQVTLDEIKYIAATNGPGLPGALTIGFSFMKAMAWNLKVPFLPINHLEGHIFSTHLSNNIEFPFLCFSLSGGHTNAYLVSNYNTYELVGKTRDDACGECFDKIAKLLKLGYPGGQKIENLAKMEIFENKNNYPISDLQDGSISFSGLKTAVLYDLKKKRIYDDITHTIDTIDNNLEISAVATSVQYVITEMLIKWINFFLKKYHVNAISLVGGVACNNIIKAKVNEYAKINFQLQCFFPEKKHCGDNAEMIAYAAHQKIQNNFCFNNIYNQNIFS